MTDKKSKIGAAGSYKEAGVDIEASERWTQRLAKLSAHLPEHLAAQIAAEQGKMRSGPGSYAAVYALSDSHWVATATDGVGTKILWYQQGLGEPADMAADLLAMNANDLLCVGARPRLFLDYLALGDMRLLEPGALLGDCLAALSRLCLESGQLLVGGETAQMPDLYAGEHFDVAGFSVGFLSPEDFLSNKQIVPGSELWAWPSSGPHSNGYTWLRKLFCAENDSALIRGHFMKGTKLYVNEVDTLRQKLKEQDHADLLQGLFHITGSGLLNLLRHKNLRLGFDLGDWPEQGPKWLQLIRERAQASGEEELWRTFNMGMGMIGVFSSNIGVSGRSLLESLGMQPLGRVRAEPGLCVRALELGMP